MEDGLQAYYYNPAKDKTCWDSPLLILRWLIDNKVPVDLDHSVKDFVPVMTKSGNHTDYIKVIFKSHQSKNKQKNQTSSGSALYINRLNGEVR